MCYVLQHVLMHVDAFCLCLRAEMALYCCYLWQLNGVYLYAYRTCPGDMAIRAHARIYTDSPVYSITSNLHGKYEYENMKNIKI